MGWTATTSSGRRARLRGPESSFENQESVGTKTENLRVKKCLNDAARDSEQGKGQGVFVCLQAKNIYFLRGGSFSTAFVFYSFYIRLSLLSRTCF